MLITVILDWPSSPRFTRVHHGSLGLGTVDQGVLLRQHSSRPRLAQGVRGWARQLSEASRCLADDTAVVTLVQVVCTFRAPSNGDHGIPGAGYIKSETAHVFHSLTLTVNIFQILFRRTLPPRNTS